MSFLPPRRRKRPLILQLTAMIDIFALIVIFLIKGTVFGVADVPVPEGMRLPASVSKESIESAPRVQIFSHEVRTSLSDEALPVALFQSASAADPRMAAFKAMTEAFVKNLSPAARASGVLLNVVADRKTPYREVFDTIRFFRQAGFETILFVSTGAEPGSGGGGT